MARNVRSTVELRPTVDGGATVTITGDAFGKISARITAAEIAERLVPRSTLAENVRNLVKCEHPAPMATGPGYLWCGRCGAMKTLDMQGWHRPDEHAWLRDAVGV
ncbi:MAG: hypothetical protein KGK07_13670 [Chloroflexota bacterium]|nr:hypothetical protein [Chloroflexota bacterium]